MNDALTIQIGRDSRRYRIVLTDAPASFDGFGTLSLGHVDQELGRGRSEDCRYVLIDEKHFDWQTMRYRSGLHVAVTAENNPFDAYLLDASEVQRTLWQALEAGLNARNVRQETISATLAAAQDAKA